MESIREIFRSYGFADSDEENLAQLAQILLPESDNLAEDFYGYLAEDSYTASFFPDEASVERRKQTLKRWFQDLLTLPYDRAYVQRLHRIGKTHVRIGLEGHYVNAALHFVRSSCHRSLAAACPDHATRERLLATLNKVLDINLDVITSSYREEELKKVFLSRRLESYLVQWAERMLHGLNLVLTIGLLIMAIGILCLFGYDVYQALTGELEKGVIQALGSLLVLWMMIELLHAEIGHLRGGHIHVRIFLELALVAFIRKLFVAALEKGDPLQLALLLAALLVLGLIFFLVTRTDQGEHH